MTTIDDMIAGNDLDELVREVDRCCERRDWEGLQTLRRKARQATEIGRQMWPAASLAEYRLALEAPAEHAASVVVENAGHLALGPLAEVAATNHTWAELADYLAPGPLRAVVAEERAARGEQLPDSVPPPDSGVPLALQAWEPTYPAPIYRPDRLEDPPPRFDRSGAERITLAEVAHATPHDHSLETDTLVELTRTWTAGSNGSARAVAVDGDLHVAVAAATHPTASGDGEAAPAEVDIVAVGLDAVMAMLAWAAASGGAYGRRRGLAFGRSTAFWTVAVLAGLDEDWPVPSDELLAEAQELEWALWLPVGDSSGWSCRVAVADPGDGMAWALDATDHSDDENENGRART